MSIMFCPRSGARDQEMQSRSPLWRTGTQWLEILPPPLQVCLVQKMGLGAGAGHGPRIPDVKCGHLNLLATHLLPDQAFWIPERKVLSKLLLCCSFKKFFSCLLFFSTWSEWLSEFTCMVYETQPHTLHCSLVLPCIGAGLWSQAILKRI